MTRDIDSHGDRDRKKSKRKKETHITTLASGCVNWRDNICSRHTGGER